MVRRSVWVEKGLVNGAIGEIVAILFEPGTQPPNLPFAVLVHFHSYRGPSCLQDVPACRLWCRSFLVQHVSILGMEMRTANSRWRLHGQLPFTSTTPLRVFSRALSLEQLTHVVHLDRSQGLTLERAVVDLGTSNSEHTVGLGLVALPRVKSLEGLMILQHFPTVKIVKCTRPRRPTG